MQSQTAAFDIATDMDEVLVMTNDKWIKAILSDKFLMAEMPKECRERAISSHPMNRPEYALLSHFSDQHAAWDPMLQQRMMDKYFMDDCFYDDLAPARYYHMLYAMMEVGALRSLTVVTACVNLAYPVTKSKIRYLNKIFEPFKAAGVKVRFLFTEKGEKKSAAINDNGVEYHTFVDDHLHNIADVAQNTISFNREFMIPRYRFNVNFPEARRLQTEKDCKILWFDNGLTLNGDRLMDRTQLQQLHTGEELAWHC